MDEYLKRFRPDLKEGVNKLLKEHAMETDHEKLERLRRLKKQEEERKGEKVKQARRRAQYQADYRKEKKRRDESYFG